MSTSRLLCTIGGLLLGLCQPLLLAAPPDYFTDFFNDLDTLQADLTSR